MATDDAEFAAFDAAFVAFSRAAKRSRARTEPESVLSAPQCDLLLPLLAAEDAPRGLRELARAAGVSAPTATRMLDGLEARGLVTRERAADDKRAVRIALTEPGVAAVQEHRARLLARRRRLFELLSAGERRAAARVLRRLAAAYEEVDEQP